MNLTFLPEALQEFEDAALHYANCAVDLDLRFIERVNQAIEQVLSDPLRWPLYRQDVRRCLVPPFPYAILYRAKGDEVLIVAIMHCHRRPGYWKERW